MLRLLGAEIVLTPRARGMGGAIAMAKKLLEESLGVKPRKKGTNRSDFEEFCGIWSESELAEFEEKTKDLSNINHEDWQ